MSTQLDNKVVTLKLDSTQFESAAQRSSDAANNLNKSLEMKGATKGLNGISQAAKNVNMSGVQQGATRSQLAIQALATAAGVVFGNIGTQVVTLGAQLIKSLTVKPIMDGFGEYELKMKSVQTILSNTRAQGTKLADVTRVLDDLNTYADKTVYVFSDMTKAVGLFTAAGVPLEKSATAIKGISNLAATVGADANSTSRVMFQLSQALSTGTVKLQDWISVENTAGMGGKMFQDALIATAKRHGVAVDAMIKKNGSFRASLQEGWLSADILNETLNNFTVDGARAFTDAQVKAGKMTREEAAAMIEQAQMMEENATEIRSWSQLVGTVQEEVGSGWAQTWEILLGDFNESTKLFTKLGNTITRFFNNISAARNQMLSAWKSGGGRDAIVQSIYNILDAAKSITQPIQEAFYEINASKAAADRLLALSKAFQTLTQSVKLSVGAQKALHDIAYAVLSVLRLINSIVSAAVLIISPAIRLIGMAAEAILTLIGSVANFVPDFSGASDAIMAFATKLNQLENAGLDKLQAKFDTATNAVIEFARGLRQDLGNAISTAVGKIREYASEVASKLTKTDGFKVMQKAWGELSKSFGEIKMDALAKVNEWIDKIKKSLQAISPDIFNKIQGGFKKIGGDLSSSTSQQKVVDALSTAFKNLAKTIEFVAKKLSKFKETVSGVPGKIAALFAPFKASKIVTKGVNESLAGVTKLSSSFANAESNAKSASTFIGKVGQDSNTMGIAVSTAAASVTTSTNKIPNAFQTALTAVKYFAKSTAESLGILGKSGKFSDGLGGKLKELAWSSKKHAMTFSQSMEYAKEHGVQALINLDRQYAKSSGSHNKFADTLSKALTAAGKGFEKFKDAVGKVFQFISKNSDNIFKTVNRVLDLFIAGKIAKSTKNIQESAKAIASIPKTIMAPFQKVKKSMAEQLMTIAKAITLLASAMLVLSMVDPIKLGKGIAGLASVIAEVVGIFKVLEKAAKGMSKDQASTFETLTKSLMKVSESILILSAALLIIARVKPGQFKQALVGISALLGELLIFLIVIDKTIGSEDIGNYTDGLLKVATAILIMSVAMKKLSSIAGGEGSWKKVGQTIVLFGAIIAAIIVLVKQLAKVDPGELTVISETLGRIARAILTMSTSMKILSTIHGDSVVSTAFLFAEIAVAIGLLVKSLANISSNKSVNTGKVTALAWSMIPISAAMVILAASMKIMSTIDPTIFGQVGALFAEAGGILIAIVAVMGLISKTAKVGPILALGPVLIAIGTTMVLMAAAFKIIGSVDPGNMKAAGVIFAIAEGTILAFVAIAGHLSSGAGKILALTPTLIALGACMVLMAAAFRIVNTMNPDTFTQSAVIFGLMAGAVAAIFIVLDKFNAGATTLLAASTVLLSFGFVMGQMAVAFTAITLAMMAGTPAYAAAILMESLFLVILGLFIILEGFNGHASTLVAATAVLLAFATVIGVFGNVMVMLASLGPSLTPAMVAMGILLAAIVILSAILLALAKLPGGGIAAAASMSMVLISLSVAMISFGTAALLVAKAIATLAAIPVGSLVAGIIALAAGIAILVVAAVAIAALSPIFITAGAALVVFGAGLTLVATAVLIFAVALRMIMELILGVQLIASTAMTTTTAQGQSFFSNIGSAVGGFFKNLFGKIGSFIASVLGKIGGFFVSLITKFGKGAADAISKFASNLSPGKILSKIGQLISQAGKSIAKIAGKFKDAGLNAISGLIKGLSIKKVVDHVISLGKKVTDKLKSILKIGSPSKVWKDIGYWTVEGLVRGIDRQSGEAVRSVGSLGQAVVEQLNDTLSQTPDSLGDLALNPTITPVLDLSNVKAGANGIQSMLDQTNAAIGVSGLNAANVNLQNGYSAAETNAIDKLTSAVKSLITNSDQPVINVYGTEGQDVNSLADAVSDRIIQVSRRRAAMV